ncbi:MAG: hypothetical protein IJ353_02240 [Lachnospiraceae bacterium]|nr:hypothetical protein [Lachnospiraceae bacterium]
MSTKYREKRSFFFFLIMSTVAAILNITHYQSSIGLVFVVIEIALLLYLLLRHKYVEYLCLYTIFISMSLEFTDFANVSYFYNLKDIRLFGLNLGIWLGVPLLILFFINFTSIKKRVLSELGMVYKFGKYLIIMNFVAVFVGGLLLLCNDNYSQKLENAWSLFFGETYQFLFLPMIYFAGLAVAILFDKNNVYKLKIALQAILWACVIQQIFGYVFEIKAYYGGTTIALSSNVTAFTPLLMVFFFHERCMFPKITGIIGLIGVVLSFLTGAGGKGIIVTVLVLLIVEMQALKSKRRVVKALGFILPVGLVLGSVVVLNIAVTKNDVLAWKIYSVKSLFSFGPDWISNMAHSPRIRIGEFLNVFMEYCQKPWLIITGKGFLGTVKDYSGIWDNPIVSYDAFSDNEWNAGIFYNMHEITSYILVFGIMGIRYAWKYVYYVYKNFKYSIWLIFGAYWFLVYYGFSFTIAAFGCLVFFYSIYEAEWNLNKEGSL